MPSEQEWEDLYNYGMIPRNRVEELKKEAENHG